MNFREKLSKSRIFIDGATGTVLQSCGLKAGELPERLNLTDPKKIIAVHRAYLNAGSDVIYTNTFGANRLKFGDGVADAVIAGVRCAREAVKGFADRFVALDVGPTGRLLKPLGDLDFEEAVDIFKETITAGVRAGVDLIAIETMSDLYELKACIVAAKEVCDLPIIATVVFGHDGKTLTGATPETVVALCEGLGVDVAGINCSLSPAEMKETVRRLLAVSSIPVAVKPNAGLPKEIDGRTVFPLSKSDFAAEMKELIECGAAVVGGCCGTTPEYISELIGVCRDIPYKPVEKKNLTVITSYSKSVYFGGKPVLIGERINPTGKKRLKQALKDNDLEYVLQEAVSQEERGAQALDVNVGLPDIDERKTLVSVIKEIQTVTDLPLQIDTSDPSAMEAAMRCYNGIPLVNSVCGKAESMRSFFPLVKKYGGVLICLTLDENGIPDTAAGRAEIAKKIIFEAQKYGIEKNRLVFDPLATAVSADPKAALVSLEAIKIIREELGCNTSLGISNISFGLPQRDLITSTYFALALQNGLSAAIYNPYSIEVNRTLLSYMALKGFDEGCEKYVELASGEIAEQPVSSEEKNTLYRCIIKGLKKEAAEVTRELIKTLPPLEIVNTEIIPALDETGRGFENKTVFLPRLLMSAETASVAFGVVKTALKKGENAKRTKIIMATVKGDIHDIGKNIVCTVLENYGFNVLDLGKDVGAEEIAAAVESFGADIVGLSALMTTTVVSMKEAVALLKARFPRLKICVGGAVLTPEYAEQIGADRYCRDAMATVRYAEETENSL